MKTETEIICDVIGCGKEAIVKVDCCHGWVESDGALANPNKYKKFEKPLQPNKTDLCDKHWKEWSILTCKLLKMDKERKR